jgi:putative transposase
VRIIRLEDRQKMTQLVEHAHASGARLKPACQLAGIDLRTLQRWKASDGLAWRQPT